MRKRWAVVGPFKGLKTGKYLETFSNPFNMNRYSLFSTREKIVLGILKPSKWEVSYTVFVRAPWKLRSKMRKCDKFYVVNCYHKACLIRINYKRRSS